VKRGTKRFAGSSVTISDPSEFAREQPERSMVARSKTWAPEGSSGGPSTSVGNDTSGKKQQDLDVLLEAVVMARDTPLPAYSPPAEGVASILSGQNDAGGEDYEEYDDDDSSESSNSMGSAPSRPLFSGDRHVAQSSAVDGDDPLASAADVLCLTAGAYTAPKGVGSYKPPKEKETDESSDELHRPCSGAHMPCPPSPALIAISPPNPNCCPVSSPCACRARASSLACALADCLCSLSHCQGALQP
jgi:hypothetical protein